MMLVESNLMDLGKGKHMSFKESELDFLKRKLFVWPGWILVAMHRLLGFLWLWRAGATLRWSVWVSHCGGFSLQSTGSDPRDFSSCDTQA